MVCLLQYLLSVKKFSILTAGGILLKYIASPLDCYLIEIPTSIYTVLFIYHYPTSADFSCLISSDPPIKLCLPPIVASSCYSITQPCPTLWSPLDCNMSGFLSFTISQSLFKLMTIELMMPSSHLILCRPFTSCPQPFPASRSCLRSMALNRFLLPPALSPCCFLCLEACLPACSLDCSQVVF